MGATITGRWLTSAAVPITGTVFYVQRYSSTPVSVLGDRDPITTDGSGNFAMTLQAGTYLVTGPLAGGSLTIKVPASSGTFTFSSLIIPNS